MQVVPEGMSPAHFYVRCDFCARWQILSTPVLRDAIEEARQKGWTCETLDVCPPCVKEKAGATASG